VNHDLANKTTLTLLFLGTKLQ